MEQPETSAETAQDAGNAGSDADETLAGEEAITPSEPLTKAERQAILLETDSLLDLVGREKTVEADYVSRARSEETNLNTVVYEEGATDEINRVAYMQSVALIHEIGHLFTVEDHYGTDGKPGSSSVLHQSRQCIYGENSGHPDVIEQVLICQGCTESLQAGFPIYCTSLN